MALVAEEIDALRALLEAVYSEDKNGRVRKSLRLPRPYDEKPKQSSLAQIEAFAARHQGVVKVEHR